MRGESATCKIRGIGAYGIIVVQERNQVMDSGGTPETSPIKKKETACGGFVILEELIDVTLLSPTGRGVSTPRFAALHEDASALNHDSALTNSEGAMDHNCSIVTFNPASSHRRGLALRWLLAAFSSMRRPWTNRPFCAIRNRMAIRDARRSGISADRPGWTAWRYCGNRIPKGGDAAGE